MAKRGRPKSDASLKERVLVRMDKPLKAALRKYTLREGHGAVATSVRVIATAKMREEGLL